MNAKATSVVRRALGVLAKMWPRPNERGRQSSKAERRVLPTGAVLRFPQFYFKQRQRDDGGPLLAPSAAWLFQPTRGWGQTPRDCQFGIIGRGSRGRKVGRRACVGGSFPYEQPSLPRFAWQKALKYASGLWGHALGATPRVVAAHKTRPDSVAVSGGTEQGAVPGRGPFWRLVHGLGALFFF